MGSKSLLSKIVHRMVIYTKNQETRRANNIKIMKKKTNQEEYYMERAIKSGKFNFFFSLCQISPSIET